MAAKPLPTHDSKLVPVLDRQGIWTLVHIATLPSGKLVALRAPQAGQRATVLDVLLGARAGSYGYKRQRC